MNWREECRRVHLNGIEFLAREEHIACRIKIYNANGVCHSPDLVLMYGIDDAIRKELREQIFPLFQRYALPAGLFQSDTWAVNGRKFAEHFGLPKGITFEKYQEEYARILDEKFNGMAANLPPELMTSALFTVIKGPQIMPVAFMTTYAENKDGELEFAETQEMGGGILDIFPDWWETVIN